ncbi:aminotransferase class I/II-fold pyridoxal phosphate-dependent enzyme [Candidatus Bipolaricaulota bacterium]
MKFNEATGCQDERDSPIGARMIVNGQEVDCFCGTSYFTLHAHPAVIQASCAATKKYGMGPSTIAGASLFSETVEIARSFFQAEALTYTASGYLGAMVLAQALQGQYDSVFLDENSHYSIFDGVNTSNKPIFKFNHLDPNDLAGKLQRHMLPGEVPLIMTDGVFPATGMIAPLPAYCEIISNYDNSLLCVDDSHAVGVIGKRGQGTFEYFGLQGDNLHYFGTLSKAFGGMGGIIPSSQATANRIEKYSRVVIGASRPPIPAIAASGMGIQVLAENPDMRKSLWANARSIRSGIRELGFEIDDSVIPIVNIPGSPSLNLRNVKAELDRQRLSVLYLPPKGYSDAPNVESIRIAVFSTHCENQIDRLVSAIRKAI